MHRRCAHSKYRPQTTGANDAVASLLFCPIWQEPIRRAASIIGRDGLAPACLLNGQRTTNAGASRDSQTQDLWGESILA